MGNCLSSERDHDAAPEVKAEKKDSAPPEKDATSTSKVEAPSAVPPPEFSSGRNESPDISSQDPTEFRHFTLDELLNATENFSEQNIVSEGGRQALNMVYRGLLKPSGLYIAVKRFHRKEWDDSEQFSKEAQKVGRVRYEGVIPLLGYCCEGDSRLLVAEYLPNSTLAQSLFHWEHMPMAWLLRLNVAIKVAQAIHHLGTVEGLPVYHDLNPYRVLFDKEQAPKLSCFGLMKPMKDGNYSSNLANIPPEYYLHGTITAESVVYSFGVMLLALFSGKSIRPTQFLELVEAKHDLSLLLDSNLLGRPGVDQAMELVPLIAECLRKNPAERPKIGTITDFLCLLDDKSKGLGSPSLPHSNSLDSDSFVLSPFAKAASSGDFPALKMLLISVSSTPPQEPSFETWNSEMQECLSARLKGDKAFKNGLWEDAAMHYSKFLKLGAIPSPAVYAKRCVSYLNLGQWQDALADAMQANYSIPGWPEAAYLQAAALRQLGMDGDAEEMLMQGAKLEQSRSPTSQRFT